MADSAAAAQTAPDKYDRPVRPNHLRGQMIFLHALLAGAMVFFAFFATAVDPSAHLLVLAVLTVTLGCKASNFFYCLLADEDPDALDGSGVDNEDLGPVISEGEAGRMPIMGSCVLFGLFCVYKYVPGDWVKLLFTAYVVFMCMGGLGVNISDLVNLLRNRTTKPVVTLPYLDLPLTYVDMAGYVLAGALGYYYILTKDDYEANWVVNNVFGVSFCLLGMKHVNISTYKTGAIMLCGLFVYDVFWVFLSKPLIGSNVMVTVAKGVKAPIKLMFPKIGTSMLAPDAEAHPLGMWPSQRTPLARDAEGMVTTHNTSELVGCKLNCIYSDECQFMSWDNETSSLEDACSYFSAAAEGALAQAAHEGVQWFYKGDKFMPSMLGLGDIVVPGIFLSLLGKWDTARLARAGDPEGWSTYFNVTMVAYTLSLVCTLVCMLFFEAAQPALLYIVPFVLIASMAVAAWRGEVSELWEFEVPGAEEDPNIKEMIKLLTDEEGTPRAFLTSKEVAEMKALLDKCEVREYDEGEEEPKKKDE